jgi:[ribosomal protein S5]-alanine N-acetyltransferase
MDPAAMASIIETKRRNMRFYIETERLILRDILPEDEQAFFALDSDPEVHRYLGNKPVKHIDEIRAAIAFITEQYQANGIGRWAAIEKSSGDFIGWSGLKLIREPKNNRVDYYDVGYRLRKEFWGKGYATESAKAALKYGFEHFGPEEIIGTAHVDNKASRRALEKCGLTFVESFDSEGIPCDWLSITKEEWAALNHT